MDSYLKLKLAMVYKDLPIEQIRSRFEELKGSAVQPPVPVRRKLRFPTKK
jgi:hypothetical protein